MSGPSSQLSPSHFRSSRIPSSEEALERFAQQEEVRDKGKAPQWFRVKVTDLHTGKTRVNVKIIDEDSHNIADINFPGPAASPAAWPIDMVCPMERHDAWAS